MLTTTKKPTTEWTDVARARELLRDAVEAKRAHEQYRPVGRLSCAGYCAPLLVGIPREELDSMRENLRLHGHEGGLYRPQALAEGTIFGHIERREWPSPPGRKPDILQFDGLTEREFRILTVLAAQRVEHSSPGVFGLLNGSEHEREQRELGERKTRALAALRTVDKNDPARARRRKRDPPGSAARGGPRREAHRLRDAREVTYDRRLAPGALLRVPALGRSASAVHRAAWRPGANSLSNRRMPQGARSREVSLTSSPWSWLPLARWMFSRKCAAQ